MSLPTPTHAESSAAPKRMRYSAVELLVTLVVLFALSPFVQDARHGHLIQSVLFSIVLIAAVIAIGVSGRTLWVACLLCAAAVATRWEEHFFPGLGSMAFFHGCNLVFLLFVVVQLLRYILSAPRVDSEVVCAAISAYLLIGLIWSLNYMLVGEISPGAFSFSGSPLAPQKMDNFNAFYFSFVVLSTIGFGDIAPVSRVARMLAVTEAVTGMFYMTVLMARLMAMYPPRSRASSDSTNPDHDQ